MGMIYLHLAAVDGNLSLFIYGMIHQHQRMAAVIFQIQVGGAFFLFWIQAVCRSAVLLVDNPSRLFALPADEVFHHAVSVCIIIPIRSILESAVLIRPGGAILQPHGRPSHLSFIRITVCPAVERGVRRGQCQIDISP